MHRIFIAIRASEELQERIRAWREKFSLPSLRWFDGKNLHITLIPPWYEDEVGLERIKELLSDCEMPESFEILFEKITYGPDPSRPRLIWLEGETPQELIELKNKLEKILDQKPEKRLLKLHLTIARFRPENFKSFSQKKLDEKISWSEEIKSVVLMESKLTPLPLSLFFARGTPASRRLS